jgi:hypothetical protein
MNNSEQPAHRKPTCILIAASLPLFPVAGVFLINVLSEPEPDVPGSIPSLDGVALAFLVLGLMVLTGFILSVVSLLRRERLRWLAWTALVLYGLPILYALQIWLGALY